MTVLLALTPLVIAAVMLLGLRRSSREAGVVTLLVTLALALRFPPFQLSEVQIVQALGTVVTTACTAMAILFPALLFFQVQRVTRVIDTLMWGIHRIIPERDPQMLLLVFGIGPCIEAMCSFGIGALLILPLLAAHQSKKFSILSLSLLSQLLVPWGGFGYVTTLAAAQSGVNARLLGAHTALLLFPAALGVAFIALFVSGRKEAVLRYWLLAVTVATTLIGGTWFFSQALSAEIAGVLSSLLVIVLLLLFSWIRKLWQRDATDVFLSQNAQEGGYYVSALWKALLPYLIILAGLFTDQFYLPFHRWAQTHGVITYAPIHLSFPLLASPGVWILLASCVTVGLFAPSRASVCSAVGMAWRRFIPVISAIILFLSVAALMQACGMIAILVEAIAPLGKNYLWLAPIIAWLGGWMTSSTVSGNALYIPLQRAVSTRVGLPLDWMIPAQNASAAVASAISPARLTLLDTAIEHDEQEEKVQQEMGLVVAWVVGTITLCLAWFVFAVPVMLCLVLLLFYVPLLCWYGLGKLWAFEKRSTPGDALSLPKAGDGSLTQAVATPRLFTKFVAYSGVVLVQLLYASFSPVANPVLKHLDPTVFNSLVMLLLVPMAMCLLIYWRKELSRTVAMRGVLFGLCLGTAFLSLTLALKDTNITQTTIFSCVNGVIAALISWLILRQRIQVATWGACLFSIAGAALVWFASTAHWQGNFTAFIGGALFTTYAFLVDYLLADDLRTSPDKLWPVLGVQLLTRAGVALAFALCSGNWHTLATFSSSDGVALGYVAVMSTFLPLIISPLVLRHVNVVTVAFFAVVEPLVSVGYAFTSGERLPILGYVGFGVVLVGVVLQALVGGRDPASSEVHESVVTLALPDWEEQPAQSVIRIPADQAGNNVLGRNSRAILAHLASAPQEGLDIRSLQMSTALSYAQLQHLLLSLRTRGYVIVNQHRRYELHPDYRPSAELFWYAS